MKRIANWRRSQDDWFLCAMAFILGCDFIVGVGKIVGWF